MLHLPRGGGFLPGPAVPSTQLPAGQVDAGHREVSWWRQRPGPHLGPSGPARLGSDVMRGCRDCPGQFCCYSRASLEAAARPRPPSSAPASASQPGLPAGHRVHPAAPEALPSPPASLEAQASGTQGKKTHP
uniref:Uncharacterized protein n=1 Tax=Molossus molossus TaxID=27622 RepID=A0A7J8DPI6_MOLMO|nr:hypothetical protein HJG59_009212 [Molossus molossus]